MAKDWLGQICLSMTDATPPRLDVFDHVGGEIEAHLEHLLELSNAALPDCIAAPAQAGEVPLANLVEIEISVVSDERIAAVHGQFMDDPTPTDVITFHHGEILVSWDTARQRAAEFDHPPMRELLLYVIHGLLHLNGHDDHEAHDRRRMHAIQDRVLAAVWPLPEGDKS